MRKLMIAIATATVLMFTACGDTDKRVEGNAADLTLTATPTPTFSLNDLAKNSRNDENVTEKPTEEATAGEEPTPIQEAADLVPGDFKVYSDYGSEDEKEWFDGSYVMQAEYYEQTASAFTGKTYPVVKLTLNDEGKQLMSELSGELVGTGRKVAFVLQDKLIWESEITVEITDGLVNVKAKSSEQAVKLEKLLNGE